MKRAVSAIIIAVLMLSGCGGIELSNRAIVGALGIDFHNGIYTVTAAAVKTESGNGSEAQYPIELHTAEDTTLFSAFEELRSNTSSEIYFGHNTILLVGIEAAREKLSEIVDFSTVSDYVRLNVNVLFCAETAAELLSLNTSDKTRICGSLKKLSIQPMNGFTNNFRLFRMLASNSYADAFGVIPVINAQRTEIIGGEAAAETYCLTANRYALVKNKSLVCEFGTYEAAALKLLLGEVKELPVTVKTGGELLYASLERPRIRRGFSSFCADGEAVIQVVGSVRVLREKGEGVLSETRLKEAVDKVVCDIVLRSLETAYSQKRIDILNLSWFCNDTAGGYISGVGPVFKVKAVLDISE